MKRVEVILTQAIKDDFITYYEQTCKNESEKCKFTIIENIMGQGNTSPKMGDPVWPQLNTMFIIFCSDKMTKKIAEIMNRLHKEYVGEGAAAFVSEAEELK